MAALSENRSAPSTKRALLAISHAMERAFEANRSIPESDRSGLVVSLFQRRPYFDVEAERYAALAAEGTLVIVAFAGSTAGLPAGVHGVSLDHDDPRARQWTLLMISGGYATYLQARDLQDLSEWEATFEASRMFRARWSFRRDVALDEARTQVRDLADLLPGHVVTDALARIERSAALPVSDGEAKLASAADHLVRSMDDSQQQTFELMRALRSSQTDAETDPLTGLKNRRFLERFLDGGVGQGEVPVLLVDLDDLKQINDSLGHEAGDAAICTVARLLSEGCKPSGVAVRWGGDEFLVILPGTDAAFGWTVATRLVQTVADARLPQPWGSIRLSVSVGVGMARDGKLPMQELDDLLYQVKRQGKGHAAHTTNVVGL